MVENKPNHFINCLNKFQENKPKYVFKSPKEKELFDTYCDSFDSYYEQPKKQIRKLNPGYIFYKYLQVCGIECNQQEIMDMFNPHKSHVSSDDDWLKLFESPEGQYFFGQKDSNKMAKEIRGKLNKERKI